MLSRQWEEQELSEGRLSELRLSSEGAQSYTDYQEAQSSNTSYTAHCLWGRSIHKYMVFQQKLASSYFRENSHYLTIENFPILEDTWEKKRDFCSVYLHQP